MEAKQPWRPGGTVKRRAREDTRISKLIGDQTENGALLVTMMLQIARGENPKMDDAKSRRWAIDRLMDRYLGKVAQVIEMPPQTDSTPMDDEPLSDEDLAILARADGYPVAPVLTLVPAAAAPGAVEDVP